MLMCVLVLYVCMCGDVCTYEEQVLMRMTVNQSQAHGLHFAKLLIYIYIYIYIYTYIHTHAHVHTYIHKPRRTADMYLHSYQRTHLLPFSHFIFFITTRSYKHEYVTENATSLGHESSPVITTIVCITHKTRS